MDDELSIRLIGSDGRQLPDRFDLEVETDPQRVMLLDPRYSSGLTGTVILAGLLPVQRYRVSVRTTRHLPVTVHAYSGADLDLCCALDPLRVTRIIWQPPCDSLTALVDLERMAGLSDLHRAGLQNIHAKMTTVDLWRFVRSVDAVQQDRIFATVAPELQHVLAVSEEYEVVSGALHAPPEGYRHAGSFKHRGFPTGILQVTLFEKDGTYRADIDIDDASGPEHVADVVEHALTNGKTHPYYIYHLLRQQQIDPGYEPVV